MSESNRNLLTIGVFIITVVVALLLWAAKLIDWALIVPVVLVLFGIWMLALGAIRAGKPVKYERSTFSTMALGLCAVAVGGAWFLFSVTLNWIYSLAVILLVVAALAIAAALKRK